MNSEYLKTSKKNKEIRLLEASLVGKMYDKKDYMHGGCSGMVMIYNTFGDNMEQARKLMKNYRLFQVIGLKLFTTATTNAFSRALNDLKNFDKHLSVINTADILYNSSSTEILKDALRGILMLQTTYKLDITKLANAEVLIEEEKVPPHTKTKREKLNAQDLMAIGKQAFMYGWYDTSILFLLEAYNMIVRKKDTFQQFKSSKQILTSAVAYHNRMLLEYGYTSGESWKAFDYLVYIDGIKSGNISTLTFIKQHLDAMGNEQQLKHPDVSSNSTGELLLEKFRHTCRKEYSRYAGEDRLGLKQYPSCNLMHHSNTFLKLGPFNIEHVLLEPYRIVIHDFFTGLEIDWVRIYSSPLLSSIRDDHFSFKNTTNHEKLDQTVRIVGKAVQTWFNDLSYIEEAKFFEVVTETGTVKVGQQEIKDLYSYDIKHEILFRISRRMEQATLMNITSRWGATHYQVTNYGLSGMVECHIDPYGYESGVPIKQDNYPLISSGDYIATFMGWMNIVQAGGATGFTFDNHESTIKPIEGSAAFWINLDASHRKDTRSIHGGCPVLKGEKWILNKWIYSFDQWRNYPCSIKEYGPILPFTGIHT